MSDQPQLGKLITGDEERDAVHVAILPATAGEKLWPGQRVAVDAQRMAVLARNAPSLTRGIVDPYLLDAVYPGQSFYVCLFPGEVVGMRHHWQHPTFDRLAGPGLKTQSREAAKLHIEQAAAAVGLPFDEFVGRVQTYVNTGSPYVEHGSQGLQDWFFDLDAEEFWAAWFTFTDTQPTPADQMGNPFSCSC